MTFDVAHPDRCNLRRHRPERVAVARKHLHEDRFQRRDQFFGQEIDKRALRVSQGPDENLFGRRLCDFGLAIYGTATVVAVSSVSSDCGACTT